HLVLSLKPIFSAYRLKVARRRAMAVGAALLAAISVLGLASLAACDMQGLNPFASSKPAVSFKGVDITGAQYAQKLSLPDAMGQVRQLSEFKGKVVVVF